MNSHTQTESGRKRFRFADHPWVAMIVFLLLNTILLLIFAIIQQFTGRLGPGVGFLIAVFIVAPFVMRIPGTKRTFKEHLNEMRQRRSGPGFWLWLLAFGAYYLDFLKEIRLTRVRPIIPLILLGLSCWVIMALSQATGTMVHRLIQGRALSWRFILSTIDITSALPPQSNSLFTSFGSIIEEITWRGIFLALFLKFYPKRRAVIMAAFGFGIMHIVNLLGEQAPVWVLGQVVWTFITGLWYGYSVIKTDSLIPAMLVHWLGNTFIGAITSYLQYNATPTVQVVYAIIFTLGLMPAALMILWTKFFTARWMPESEVIESAEPRLAAA